MLAFTLISRYSDALPLSSDLEGSANSMSTAAPPPGTTDLKRTAKSLLQRLSPGGQGGSASAAYFRGGNALLQIDLPNEGTFVVLLDRGVLFLTVNAASGCAGSPGSPNAVATAAAYLEEIAREFGETFGEQVSQVTRPFPFLKFDNFLSRTKKLFLSHPHGASGGSSSSSSADVRRQGAGVPTKASFYRIMGLVEPASVSGGSNGGGGGGGLSSIPPLPGAALLERFSSGQKMLIVGGAFALAFLFFIWFLVRTFA
jgi:hypothetical protein